MDEYKIIELSKLFPILGLFVCCNCKLFYVTAISKQELENKYSCPACSGTNTIFIEGEYFQDLIIVEAPEEEDQH